MSRRYEIPTGDRRSIAEQAFEALSNLDELARKGVVEAARRRIPLARLYAYAVGRGADAAIERALGDDAELRAAFDRLLDKTAVPALAAAAASDDAFSRTAQGYRLRLERSRAEPTQFYVIIEPLAEGGTPPRALFIRFPDNRRRKFVLPEEHEGVIQLIESEDSEIVQSLRDHEVEVFLCRNEDQDLFGDDRGSGPD